MALTPLSMAWLKIASTSTRQRIIGGVTSDGLGWSFGNEVSGKLIFTGYGVSDAVTSATHVVANTWVHVAATKSSSSGVTIFVNGEAVQNLPTLTGNWLASTQQWALLGNDDGERLSGLVDDVRVYRGPLDAQGIREALATPVAPIGHYTFGEAQGPLRLDSAGTPTHAGEAGDSENTFYAFNSVPAGTYGALTIAGATFGASGATGPYQFGEGFWLTAPGNEFGALTNDFTVMAWVAPGPFDGDDGLQRVVGRFSPGTGGWGFGFVPDGRLILTGYGVVDVVTAATAPAGWHHLAVTKSSTGGVTFYVNGNVFESVSDRTEDWLPSSNSWALLNSVAGEGFHGEFDELQIFPAVLDLQSIRERAVNQICISPDAAITTPGAVHYEMVLDDIDLIADLNVTLDISYPQTGKLAISLRHQEGSASRDVFLAWQLVRQQGHRGDLR